ncbi:unnamed protein product [Meloidogyne enterolobii]|uniref:Uncharacterized protein n=2 Tax=Meloidogyne enterolobii TaxID=390850 RepID=A0ACB0ZUL7_MELEN
MIINYSKNLKKYKKKIKKDQLSRVTLCDFEVRYLANLNRYTVQCALLINIINEKVFTFFWLWYCLLLCITTCSTLFWLTNILLHAAKVDYILRFMQIAENSCQFINPNIQSTPFPQRTRIAEEEGDYLIEGGGHSFVPFRVPNQHGIDKFVDDFLKSDGLFILRMIANHAGELAVVGIVKHLWK